MKIQEGYCWGCNIDMNFKYITCLLLLPLILTACNSKMNKEEQRSPEGFAIGVLNTLCIDTISDAGKINDNLKKQIEQTLAKEANKATILEYQKNFNTGVENITNVWNLLNPYNGKNYNVMITNAHRCIVSYEANNSEDIKVAFKNFINKYTDSEGITESVKVEIKDKPDSQLINYKIPLKNTVLNTQLSISVENKQNPMVQLMWVPIVR